MLECTEGQIREFHAFLLDDFGPHVAAADLQIHGDRKVGRGESWRNPRFKGPQVFQLVDDRWPVRANIEHRHGSMVVQLSGFDADAEDSAWVSWLEQWRKPTAEGKFILKSADFTFYWGSASTMALQIFRAEWPEQAASSDHAGNPHWQFDHAPLATRLDIGRVHFPMAGWACGGEHPECWRRFAETTEELREWARKTLAYSRDQLVRHNPKPIPEAEDSGWLGGP